MKIKLISIILILLMLLPILEPICLAVDELFMQNDYQYYYDSNSDIVIYKYTGEDTEIEIPSQIDGNQVVGIGDRAFEYCSNLMNITIPDGIKTIGDSAFYNCTSLTNIIIPKSVTSIGKYAFQSCYSLQSVILNEGIETIADGTFEGCSNLSNIILPQGLTSIEMYAFYGCGSLSNIVIPEEVTRIGQFAFRLCTSLTDIVIPNNVKNIESGAFEDCSSLTNITLNEGLESIGAEVFINCNNLNKIYIPESVSGLGYPLFPDDVTLYVSEQSYAEKYAIENNIKYLKKCEVRFIDYDDTLLKSEIVYEGEGATAPSNPIRGGYIFTGWDKDFSDITSSLTIKAIYEKEDNDYEYYDDGNGGIIISKYVGTETVVEIPDQINGTQVTGIGSMAFSNCSSITNIIIPENVTTIGNSAFVGCSNLRQIEIPKGVITIGYSVFSGCTNLNNITIPEGVVSILDNAFESCDSLKKLDIPKGINNISNTAFPNDITLYVFEQSYAEKYAMQNNINFITKSKKALKKEIVIINNSKGNIRYVDSDNSETINTGDEIYIGDEGFYVLNNNKQNNKISMLAKYNLNVGDNYYTKDTKGIQSSSVFGLKDDHTTYGNVAFSKNSRDYTGSIVEGYVNAYVEYLLNKYEVNVTGNILTHDEAYNLLNNNRYSWAYSTTYWTRSRYGRVDNDYMSIVYSKVNMLPGAEYWRDDVIGVRPVITISASELENKVVVNDSKNGDILISNDGNIVTIMVNPNIGYKADKIIVTGANYEYTVNENDDGTYSFTFDNTYGDATVSAIYKDKVPYVKGDVNGDGKITLADYAKILAHVKGTSLLTGVALKVADVNGDGKVTLADYAKVLAYVKGTAQLE